MIAQTVVACLLVATPAFAQARVYTNADLGKPLQWGHTPTPQELASLSARQFVPMPELPDGPRAMTIEGDPSHGPFGGFALSPSQPLDPNWRGDGSSYPAFGGFPANGASHRRGSYLTGERRIPRVPRSEPHGAREARPEPGRATHLSLRGRGGAVGSQPPVR